MVDFIKVYVINTERLIEKYTITQLKQWSILASFIYNHIQMIANKLKLKYLKLNSKLILKLNMILFNNKNQMVKSNRNKYKNKRKFKQKI